MELEKSDAWRRHQLVAVERMQRDLARCTHPVIRGVGLCGVAYLASYAVVMVLGASAVTMSVTLVVALSAAVVVLGTPAFALAVGVERHLRRRLMSAGLKSLGKNGPIATECVVPASVRR